MDSFDLMYSETHKRIIKAGGTKTTAEIYAKRCVARFKRGQYKRPMDLVNDMVKEAKKLIQK